MLSVAKHLQHGGGDPHLHDLRSKSHAGASVGRGVKAPFPQGDIPEDFAQARSLTHGLLKVEKESANLR
jgi:hypothetical protein